MKNWPMIKVADEFDLQMGKTPARDNPAYWGGDQKWASIADIGRSDMYLADTKEAITQEAVSESGIKAVPPNTVVMSFKLSLGRTAITASRMYTNEAIMAFLPHDASGFDLHFLYHLFSNRNWSEGCNKAVKGVTLNKATLNAARIPKPDISEQRAVASTLDKICDLMAKCDEQIVRLDQLVKSRFVEMFGAFAPSYTLDDVCDKIQDGEHGSVKRVEQGHLFLSARNILKNQTIDIALATKISNEDYVRIVRRFNPAIGDVLLTCAGTIGNVSIVADYKFVADRGIMLLKPRHEIIVSEYLMHFLLSNTAILQMESAAHGSALKHLFINHVKKMAIPLPPLPLQREFAAFVAKVDKLAFAARQRRDVAKQLYRAKIQEFFG